MAVLWAVTGRLAAGLLAVTVLTGLTGCGGVTRFGAAPAGGELPVENLVDEGPNAADWAFLREMIHHHQQSVDMAAMVDIRGSRYEVKTLAAELQRAQRDQIAAMSGWLRDRESLDPVPSFDPVPDDGQRFSPEGPTSGPSVSPSASKPAVVAGVATAAEMSALARAGGAELDSLFLELLLRHHRRSVELAAEHRAVGADREVARLADEIVGTHQDRIDALGRLLAAD